MKICSRCKEEKSFSEFGTKSNNPDGMDYLCIICRRIQAKEYRDKRRELGVKSPSHEVEYAREYHSKWRDDNREHVNENARINARKRDMSKIRYNVSRGQREIIFNSQGRCCAICKRDTPVGKYWHLDHNHNTGQIRGILCMTCNLVVGKIENGWKVEVPAITQYLEFYSQLEGGGLNALRN